MLPAPGGHRQGRSRHWALSMLPRWFVLKSSYWIGVAPFGAPDCVTGTARFDWNIVPP